MIFQNLFKKSVVVDEDTFNCIFEQMFFEDVGTSVSLSFKHKPYGDVFELIKNADGSILVQVIA